VAPVKKPVVKIGVMLPLSGDISSYGESVRDGLLLRIDELKKEPTKFEYKFIFEDTQGIPRGAALAGKKLLEIDHVDFIISELGFVSHPIVPMVERKHIPHLCLMDWNPEIAKGSMGLVLATSINAESGLMFDVFKRLGYKRVAIICARDYEGVYALKVLERRINESGMTLADEEIYNRDGILDFIPLVIRMRESKPDVIINMTYDPDIFIIERRIKEMGIACPVTTFETYDGALDNEYVKNRWYVTTAQANSAFADKFRLKYKHGLMYGEGFAYDAVGLVAQAYEQNASDGKKPNGDTIAAYLKKVKGYHGAVGELNSNGQGIIDTTPQLMQVVDKKAMPTTIDEIVKLKENKK
jgi:branched-chain amino acid transport system substrate-binding protein